MALITTLKCDHDVQVGIEPTGPMLFPFTTCCGAAGTGTAIGVACKGCYAEISPLYGDAVLWPAEGATVGVAKLATWLEAGKCPTPQACADGLGFMLTLLTD